MRNLIKNYGWLVLFMVLKIILQLLVVNSVYELHRDEFLHLDQADHLAFGFQSVPPITSFLSVIIHWFGNNIFWVRFFPALFGALTIMVAWFIVEQAGGGIYAKIITSMALLFSVLARMNILYQPNALDILVWTLLFYLVICYIRSGKAKWLFIFALIGALGFLNKYNIVFLFIGIVPAILITKQRHLFSQKIFYQALVFMVILILPNIIWQVWHHFPVIHHMHALKEYQLENIHRIDFLKDQAMFFMGSIPLIIAAFAGLFFYKPFRDLRFIGWTFLLVVALYMYCKGKSYYAIGLYPVLIAIGSIYMEHLFHKGWKQGILLFFIISNLLVFIPIVQFVIPRESPMEIIAHADGYKTLGLLRWEDGKDHDLPQDFADMLGWREMAQKVRSTYFTIPLAERTQTLIFTDNYGQAGAVNYYNRKIIPSAYSFCTDYIFWIPQMPHIRNIILVGKRPDAEALKYFEEVFLVGTIENRFAREKGTQIFLLKGASPAFTNWFYRERDRKIRDFDFY